jgi:UDP-glucose 4-epimerase
MDTNVIITGGGGFIGSHLVDMYVRDQCNVTVIDNFSTGEHFVEGRNKTLLSCDLSTSQNMSEVEQALESADIVLHMAGSVGVKYIDNDPRGTLRNSFNINNNMFPLFEKYNNRVIFASTSEVYGETNEAHETDTLKIGSPDTLRWGYACGKLMSEFLLRTYNFPSTIVRFFNVTGHGQLSAYGMVLPTFVERAQQNVDIVVHGDGNQTRTFCDVRDAIQMIKLLTADQHIGEIYNIGNPANTLTIRELAELVINLSASSSRVVYKQYEDCFSHEFGEIYKRKPNIDKVSKYFKPIHTIENIINSML